VFVGSAASVPDFSDDELEAILAEEAINRALEGDSDFLSALDAAISSNFPDDVLNAAVAASSAAAADDATAQK
jgi:hypothetical protein